MAEHMRILVTGGASGIGRATARLLRSQGHDIVVMDVKDRPEDWDSTYIQVDLADTAATGRALAEALSGGPILGLVNNAAIARPALLMDVALDDVAAVMALNVRCPIQCAQTLLPGMRAQKFGRIVNISSRASLGKQLRTVYAASKAGIHAMTRTWALELAEDGITVNSIAPGPIETETFRQANSADNPRTQALIDSVPVRRMGQPDDIANAVAFFVSPATSYVTGQMLFVCGGMSVALAGADGYVPPSYPGNA